MAVSCWVIKVILLFHLHVCQIAQGVASYCFSPERDCFPPVYRIASPLGGIASLLVLFW